MVFPSELCFEVVDSPVLFQQSDDSLGIDKVANGCARFFGIVDSENPQQLRIGLKKLSVFNGASDDTYEGIFEEVFVLLLTLTHLLKHLLLSGDEPALVNNNGGDKRDAKRNQHRRPNSKYPGYARDLWQRNAPK